MYKLPAVIYRFVNIIYFHKFIMQKPKSNNVVASFHPKR